MFTNVYAKNPALAAAVLLHLFDIDQERAVRVANVWGEPFTCSVMYYAASDIACSMQTVFPRCPECCWPIIGDETHDDCMPCPNGCGEVIWSCSCDDDVDGSFGEDYNSDDEDFCYACGGPCMCEDEDLLADDVDPTGGYYEESYLAPGPNGPERVYYDPTNPTDPNRPLEYADEDDEDDHFIMGTNVVFADDVADRHSR